MFLAEALSDFYPRFERMKDLFQDMQFFIKDFLQIHFQAGI